MQKIAIIGAGAFGFAVAKIVGDMHSKKDIFIFDIQKEYIEHIRTTKKHPLFEEDVKIAPHIIATHSLEEAVKNADMVILAVPSVFMRSVVKDVRQYLDKETILLNIAKGLEKETNKTMSEVISEELTGLPVKHNICALSGGMIAREVILQNPLCADVACKDIKVARKVARLIENEHLRLEVTADIIGVDLAGAFKNVVAIGAGIFDGLGYSESSKSAFVSYAAREISLLAFAMGAKKKTFAVGSQAWFGDLMTTCFGKSRNREFGEMLGKSFTVKETLDKMEKAKKTVEGYKTAEVVHNLILKHKIRAPLLKMLYMVLYSDMSAKKFAKDFIKAW